MEYRGKQNMTRKGIPCQRWDSTFPHVPGQTISFPEESFSAQENYCRNPDGEKYPWCYTVNQNVRWDYCDIPVCLSNKFIISLKCLLRYLKITIFDNI